MRHVVDIVSVVVLTNCTCSRIDDIYETRKMQSKVKKTIDLSARRFREKFLISGKIGQRRVSWEIKYNVRGTR